jgi:hypothetical protein
MGVSRGLAMKWAKRGELEVIWLGGRMYLTPAGIQRFVDATGLARSPS